MAEVKYIVHEFPAWRRPRNYIAMADLEPFGFPGLLEQLWLRETDAGEFEVCCIPFRVYGLSLGDSVAIESDSRRFVNRLLKPSGRRVLRIFLVKALESDRFDSVRSRLTEAVTSEDFLNEWSGDRHVAIDIPTGRHAEPILRCVEQEISENLVLWEWGDVEAFRTS